ncbi:MAG: hypothetical protein IPJ58_15125 [Ardenticatenia bacterium]|nr:hypothetical protein [Ardenticatenia bacterium]
MYISPDRDASPPRPRRGRLALGVAGGVLGLAVFLVLRPDLARLQAARLFPSPTPSPTATPSAASRRRGRRGRGGRREGVTAEAA